MCGRQSGLAGPAVVMGFGSIPYPAVSLSDAGLEDAIMAAAKPFGLSAVRYFPGISDMSFFGEASGDLSAAAANTPVWGTSFTMPEPRGIPLHQYRAVGPGLSSLARAAPCALCLRNLAARAARGH